MAIAITLSAHVAHAAPVPIVFLQERDLDNHTYPLEEGSCVDLDSRIRIEIRQPEMRRRVGAFMPRSDQLTALIVRAQKLRAIAEKGQSATRRLAEATQTFAASHRDEADLKAYSSALSVAAGPVDDIIALARGDGLEAELERALEALVDSRPGASVVEQNAVVFEAAAARAAKLAEDVDRVLQRDGVKVRLGAFLVSVGSTTPIHVEGFDNYAPQERSVHERFRLALSDEQKRKLTALTALADEHNFSPLKLPDVKAASETLRHVIAKSAPCMEQLETSLASLEKAAGESTLELLRPLREGKSAVRDVAVLLSEVEKRYVSLNIASSDAQLVLFGVGEDLARVAGALRTLLARLPQLIAELKSSRTRDLQEQLLGARQKRSGSAREK